MRALARKLYLFLARIPERDEAGLGLQTGAHLTVLVPLERQHRARGVAREHKLVQHLARTRKNVHLGRCVAVRRSSVKRSERSIDR